MVILILMGIRRRHPYSIPYFLILMPIRIHIIHATHTNSIIKRAIREDQIIRRGVVSMERGKANWGVFYNFLNEGVEEGRVVVDHHHLLIPLPLLPPLSYDPLPLPLIIINNNINLIIIIMHNILLLDLLHQLIHFLNRLCNMLPHHRLNSCIHNFIRSRLHRVVEGVWMTLGGL